MRGSTKRVVAGLCCAALAAAACSGDDEADETAPVPTADAEESAPSTEESAPEVDDSVATDPEESEPVDTDPPDGTEPTQTDPPETTTATTESAPERRLPEDLGPVTDSIPYPDAPGVDAPGEFYEIYDMGYVYLPFEDDPDDPNVVAPTEDELSILAAWAEAQAAGASQTFFEPVSADPNDLVRAAFVDRGQRLSESVFAVMASDGLVNVFPVDAADVFRPRVDRQSSTNARAVILDCTLISSTTVTVGGDEPPGYEPFVQNGLRVELLRISGEWLVDFFEPEASSCT